MTAMTRDQLLSSLCSHGVKLRDCQQLWCRSRVEDLLEGPYEAKLPEIPESG